MLAVQTFYIFLYKLYTLTFTHEVHNRNIYELQTLFAKTYYSFTGISNLILMLFTCGAAITFQGYGIE